VACGLAAESHEDARLGGAPNLKRADMAGP